MSIGGPLADSPICSAASGSVAVSTATAFNISSVRAPLGVIVVTDAFSPPASVTALIGISAIISNAEATPFAVSAADMASPSGWLWQALTAVVRGSGGTVECMGTPAGGGGVSSLAFGVPVLIAPLQVTSAGALADTASSDVVIVARISITVSSLRRPDNSSLLVQGWRATEAVTCSLGATTLVLPSTTTALRSALNPAADLLIPVSMHMRIGGAIRASLWRTTWPSPAMWQLGPAVASQAALPQDLRSAPTGSSSAAALDAFVMATVAASTVVDLGGSARMTLCGPTLIVASLEGSPLAGELASAASVTRAKLLVSALFVTGSGTTIAVPTAFDSSGRVVFVSPSADALCPQTPSSSGASSERLASSELAVTTAACPRPRILLVTRQTLADASAARAAVCLDADLIALDAASATTNLTPWGSIEAIDAAAGAYAPLLGRGGGVACPPSCGGSTATLLDGGTGRRLLATVSLASADTSSGLWDGAQPVPALPTLAVSSEGGILFVRPCIDLSLVPADVPSLPALCSNASDPRSAGSAGLCFWGQSVDCTPCPAGGICPGGYRLWSAPGFFVPTETWLRRPTECASPASERCAGWSEAAGGTLCGPGYVPGGFGCSLCDVGFYTDSEGASTSKACLPCPSSSLSDNPLSAFTGVAIAGGAVIGLGVALGLLSAVLTSRAGSSPLAALRRTLVFMMTTFTALQLLAEIARAPPPDAAPLVGAIFTALRFLQFRGIGITPLACTPLSPLALPMGLMLLGLVVEAYWLLLTASWLMAMHRRRLLVVAVHASPPASANSRRSVLARRSLPAAAADALSAAFAALSSLPGMLYIARAAITLAGMLFAIVTNSAFVVIACDATLMTLPQYLLLRSDGSTAASALGIPASALRAVNDTDVLSTPFAVQLLHSNPSLVCGEGDHVAAAIIARVTIALFTVGLPLIALALLRVFAVPAALAATPVPPALLPDARQIAFGGAVSAAVLAHVLGKAAAEPPAQFRGRCCTAPRLPPASPASADDMAESDLDLFRRFSIEAARRRRIFVSSASGFGVCGTLCCGCANCPPDGPGASARCAARSRQACATVCGVGSRYVLSPPPGLSRQRSAAAVKDAPTTHAASRLAAQTWRRIVSFSRPRKIALAASQAPHGAGAIAGDATLVGRNPLALAGASKRAELAPSLSLPRSPSGLLPSSVSRAAAALPAAASILTDPVIGTLCGCAWSCPRAYARDVQTGEDVVDSSAPLNGVLPHLAPLTGADFRASQAHFVLLNWALLGVVAAANVLVPNDASTAGALITRGVLLAALFLGVLAATIAARPMRPHSEWMLPLRAYIFVLSSLGALYIGFAAAAAARHAAVDNSDASLDALLVPLGYAVAVLAAALIPIFAAVLILNQLSGGREEQRDAGVLAAAEARRARNADRAARRALAAQARAARAATLRAGASSATLLRATAASLSLRDLVVAEVVSSDDEDDDALAGAATLAARTQVIMRRELRRRLTAADAEAGGCGGAGSGDGSNVLRATDGAMLVSQLSFGPTMTRTPVMKVRTAGHRRATVVLVERPPALAATTPASSGRGLRLAPPASATLMRSSVTRRLSGSWLGATGDGSSDLAPLEEASRSRQGADSAAAQALSRRVSSRSGSRRGWSPSGRMLSNSPAAVLTANALSNRQLGVDRALPAAAPALLLPLLSESMHSRRRDEEALATPSRAPRA